MFGFCPGTNYNETAFLGRKKSERNMDITLNKLKQLIKEELSPINEGELSKKEKAYLLVDPSHLNDKGKKKKDHVDHK